MYIGWNIQMFYFWRGKQINMNLYWCNKCNIRPVHTHVSLYGIILYVRKLCLTHWSRVTHICVDNLTIIGSDNGLSPGWHQAIIWTNDGILLIRLVGTNFSEMLFRIQTFSFNKMHLKVSSVKWRPFRIGLNVSSRSILCRMLSTKARSMVLMFKWQCVGGGNDAPLPAKS